MAGSGRLLDRHIKTLVKLGLFDITLASTGLNISVSHNDLYSEMKHVAFGIEGAIACAYNLVEHGFKNRNMRAIVQF